MGTRGIYGVVRNGKELLIQKQFDCYPEGLGYEMLDQLREVIKNKKSFIELVDNCQQIDDPKKCNVEMDCFKSGNGLTVMAARDRISNLLEALNNGAILNDKRFGYDSLWCEWGYVIDVSEDVWKLEVYTGYDAPQGGRFFSDFKDESDYGPINLIHTYEIDTEKDIPTNEEFLKTINQTLERGE